MKYKTLLALASVCLAIASSAACTPGFAPARDAGLTSTAQAYALGQTQVALQATSLALGGLLTKQAAPSATPTAAATLTVAPTATVTPGPVLIDDDFSRDAGRWPDCSGCLISDGVMYMGPYPAVDSGQGYVAICKDCGIADGYKMSVDVSYISGASDRGYGLVLWEQDGYYIDFEISTWKTYAAWFYNKEQGASWNAWSALLPVTISSAVRAGRLTNHLEAVVSTQNGRKSLSMQINGHAIQSTQLKGGSGRVGLVVGLHSIGVAFDNFHFEATP